ncbi:hypothetical protein BaRGS_00006493 [Batillaria attramentaria]|uniref:Uncharacterized protein n=1 Tax=Batillaria attramentaria TaxID=370345 RepID=A0ABD0LR10_9CAEN
MPNTYTSVADAVADAVEVANDTSISQNKVQRTNPTHKTTAKRLRFTKRRTQSTFNSKPGCGWFQIRLPPSSPHPLQRHS